MKKKMDVYLAALVIVLGMTMIAVPRVDARGSSEGTEDKPLIVYSNQTGTIQKEWFIAAIKESGINVQFVGIAGGGDMITRLIAEKNNPVADVIWGLSPHYLERLVAEDMLLKFDPSWITALDKKWLDSKGLYYPLSFSANGYMYNAAAMPAIPKDIIDFANNQAYKGKYTLGRMGSSTWQTILLSILLRYQDPKGDLGVSAEGWDLIKRLFENGHPYIQGEDTNGNMISGLYPAIPTFGAGFIQQATTNKDARLEFLVPPSGITYTIESITILKLSKQQEKAKALVEFFGSPKMQALFAVNESLCVLHPEAIKQAPPEVQALMDKIIPMAMDWAVIAQNLEPWIEKITLEYAQQ
jgi:iron(III) transport system substrate-binding protein